MLRRAAGPDQNPILLQVSKKKKRNKKKEKKKKEKEEKKKKKKNSNCLQRLHVSVFALNHQ